MAPASLRFSEDFEGVTRLMTRAASRHPSHAGDIETLYAIASSKAKTLPHTEETTNKIMELVFVGLTRILGRDEYVCRCCCLLHSTLCVNRYLSNAERSTCCRPNDFFVRLYVTL